MNLSPVATDYAVELHNKMVRGNSRSFSASRLTSAELDKRRDFARILKEFNDSTHATFVSGSFSTLINELAPIWENEIDHNVVHDFRFWFPEDMLRNYGVNPDLFRNLNGVFAKIYGQDEVTVSAWIDRIDAGIVTKPSWATIFMYDSFYTATFPVSWLDYFATRERFYLPGVISAFNKGFRPDVVKVVSPAVLLYFSPETVDEFLAVFNARVLKQLVSLETHGRQALTPEVLFNLARAGFTTAREVKDYARKFGVGFTEQNFYDRVIAAKNLYPVLEDFVPVV